MSVDELSGAAHQQDATAARAALIRQALATQDAPPGRLPRSADGTVPAAPVQLGLWLHQGLSDQPALYNVPMAVRLRGDLRVPALRSALAAVVDRHEILRTSFVESGGQLHQRIAPAVSIDWTESAVVEGPADQRWAVVEEDARREIARPFDLGTAPLLRARLWQLDDTDHVLLVVAHHLVSDGWSAGVLWRDLDTYYRGRTGQPAPELPALTLQYADFAQWQLARLDHGDASGHGPYWRTQLDGVPADLDLPTDDPGPNGASGPDGARVPGGARPGGPGASRGCSLPAELADTLRGLARTERCSLVGVLLTGFVALVHRLARADDVVVAVPVTTRQHDSVESLIGYFVNLVPVRVAVEPSLPFRELLGRTMTALTGALAHRELPVDLLSGIRRPTPRVSFSLTGTAHTADAVGDLRTEPVYFPGTTAKFDLALAFVESGEGGLTGAWEYRTDRFGSATIERWTTRLTTLLDAAAHDPDQPVGQLALMDRREREILTGWSRGTWGTWIPSAPIGRPEED